MMARTNETDVKALLLRNYDSLNNPSLTMFITSANLLVTRVAACAAAKGLTLSSEELQMLEALIAAHNYMSGPDQGSTSKSTQSASGSFQGRSDMKLESTYYGQQALVLDTSGCLNALTKGNRVSGFWLGTKDPNAGSQVNVNDV